MSLNAASNTFKESLDRDSLTPKPVLWTGFFFGVGAPGSVIGTGQREAVFCDLGARFTANHGGLTAHHCQTVVGESYLLGWRWKDRELGGSQGHLFVRRFESAPQYRIQTTSEPRLFTPRGPLRYHVSPRDVRDQIAREGLRPSADRTGLGAIFLASPKPADRSNQLDTWEVDVAGIVLHPDTSTSREEADAQRDPWYACFEHTIAPSRLKLLP